MPSPAGVRWDLFSSEGARTRRTSRTGAMHQGADPAVIQGSLGRDRVSQLRSEEEEEVVVVVVVVLLPLPLPLPLRLLLLLLLLLLGVVKLCKIPRSKFLTGQQIFLRSCGHKFDCHS